jgi:hypothetical protein
MDELKVKSKVQLDEEIEYLREIYQEITVHGGESHDYSGMVMTHNQEKWQVKIDMEH